MSAERSVVMMGPPASGKTTYLAALWHQLESAEIATAFTANKLQNDREYLNQIRERWLEFEPVPRTPRSSDHSTILHLLHVSTKKSFDLSLPHVVGESFVEQWLTRRAPEEFVKQLKNAFGVILFIHSQQVLKGQLITSAVADNTVTHENVEWDPSLTPTQVQLVDSIQSVSSVFDRGYLLRIAIVISAWDEVADRIAPGSWFERKLPLLDQYLKANSASIASRVYGISAIGGKLSEKETLALGSSPSSRVRIHVGSEVLRDLTLPLEFLTIDGSTM